MSNITQADAASRKVPETPVSQYGTSETGGRRAVFQPKHNVGKTHVPRKLSTRHCSNTKTDFTPALRGGNPKY
jgi:hypothetical protein